MWYHSNRIPICRTALSQHPSCLRAKTCNALLSCTCQLSLLRTCAPTVLFSCCSTVGRALKDSTPQARASRGNTTDVASSTAHSFSSYGRPRLTSDLLLFKRSGFGAVIERPQLKPHVHKLRSASTPAICFAFQAVESGEEPGQQALCSVANSKARYKLHTGRRALKTSPSRHRKALQYS